ncbi:MAG: hypothetical protein EOP04_32465, partial [Proteobacteria bacterium]
MKKVLVSMALLLSTSLAVAQTGGGTLLTEKSPQDYNFRFDPLSLLVGRASATLDFKIGENWTLGPDLTYWNINVTSTGSNAGKIDVNYSSAGIRGNWFKNGAFTDGFYVGPFVRYGST